MLLHQRIALCDIQSQSLHGTCTCWLAALVAGDGMQSIALLLGPWAESPTTITRGQAAAAQQIAAAACGIIL
jgi:hypothetical protein